MRVPIHERRADVSFRNEFNTEMVRVSVRGVIVSTTTFITAHCIWCGEKFSQASIDRLRNHAREHADNGDDYPEVPF